VGVVFAATAACGENGNGDETASGRAVEPEAQERAESILLKLADFPTGWRASAPEADESGRDKFNQRIGVDYSQLTRIGEAESKDFAKDSAEASSDVTIFEDEQQAEDAMSELQTAWVERPQKTVSKTSSKRPSRRKETVTSSSVRSTSASSASRLPARSPGNSSSSTWTT
jgi:hypothetical protein